MRLNCLKDGVRMSIFKEMYADATQTRLVACVGLITEFLAEKGIVFEQPCVLVMGEVSVMGVFKVVSTSDSAVLTFVPYTENGTLAVEPLAIEFGVAPEYSWAKTGITKAYLSDVPEAVIV